MVDTTKQGRDLVSFLGAVEDHWCADSREQFLQFHSEANGNDCLLSSMVRALVSKIVTF